MLALLERFEHLIAWVLSILLVVVTSLATADLIVTLFKNVVPHFLIGVDRLLELFGLFLLILLGLELLEMVKTYLQDDLIHVEVVLVVAIIAIARKVIILEFKEPTAFTVTALAVLLFSLAAAYRLIMPVLRGDEPSHPEAQQKRSSDDEERAA